MSANSMTPREAGDYGGRPEPPQNEVRDMFNRISRRYDLLNRLLSFGTDVSWRRQMARFFPGHDGQRVLDLATGTADQILALFEQTHKVRFGIGMDLAEKMLEIGRKKIERRGLSEVITLNVGDATAIPAGTEAFDAVTISFGIRNVTNVAKGIEEMYRVLKPGGRVLMLEFSLPRSPLVRSAYLFYLRHILPRVGALVSGAPLAYRYLNRTIETFPYGEVFCNLLRVAGFTAVEAHPLAFGVAMIYRGDKPVEPRMEGYAS
jgi:demethylmenaquinone methyltransferase/2-methoxy-6-polyprenyl-1,4-benzoquinol methylase